jgi:hypothetical protein
MRSSNPGKHVTILRHCHDECSCGFGKWPPSSFRVPTELGKWLRRIPALAGFGLLMLVAMVSHAQSPQLLRFEFLDTYSRNVPLEEQRSYETLAAYLMKPARTDLEKARAFFSFTVSHLHGPQTGELWSSEPAELLRDQTVAASCAGYAEVYRDLCLAGGLKAVYIRGYSRGGAWRPGNKIKPGEPDHSWNAVFVDGQWFLLDPSWNLFLTPAEQFIYKHFPLAVSRHNIHKFPDQPLQELQLLQRPLSTEEWEWLPRVDQAFFTCGLSLVSPNRGVITVVGNQIRFAIKTLPNVSLRARLLLDDVPLDWNFTKVTKTHPIGHVVMGRFPREGVYTLRIFATRSDSRGAHDFACDYRIEAKANGEPSFNGGVSSDEMVPTRMLKLADRPEVMFDQLEPGSK